MKVLAIARRDLFTFVCAPSLYLVLALFLAGCGYAFWLMVALLDGQAAPSTVLRLFFGGSLLYWLLLGSLAVLLAMKQLAGEARTGTLDLLLAAPIGRWEIVTGKYLAVLIVYVVAWLPTLAYPLLLAQAWPVEHGMDPGAVLGGYLGCVVIGATALALALLASAVTDHERVAAALGGLGFASLVVLGLAAEGAAPGGALASLAERANLMRQLDDFARGVVDTRALVLHATLTLLALAAAVVAVAGRGRLVTRRRVLAVAAIGAGCLVAGGLANRAAAGVYARWDLTRARANTVSPRTVALLRRVQLPIELHVLLQPTTGAADLSDELRDLLARLQAVAPRLHIERRVGAVAEREIADRFGLEPDQVADAALVVALGGRARIVTRAELARFERDPDGAPRLAEFLGERAFTAALLALAHPSPRATCFTTGHGELQHDSLAGAGMSEFADALRRDGARLQRLATLDEGVTASCDLIIIAGPERPFAGAEVAALDDALRRGGRLLVLLGPPLRDGKPARLEIEPLLARVGIAVEPDVVFDLTRISLRERAWAVDGGYADHPVTTSFVHRRTVWSRTRSVEPVAATADRAQALVSTSAGGFASRRPEAIAGEGWPQRQAADRGGPIVVAAATTTVDAGARVVVLGTVDLARNDHDVGYNRDLVVAAARWLVASAELPPGDAAPPGPPRLRLTDRERSRLFALCVIGMPLVWLLLGAGVWVRRRY